MKNGCEEYNQLTFEAFPNPVKRMQPSMELHNTNIKIPSVENKFDNSVISQTIPQTCENAENRENTNISDVILASVSTECCSKNSAFYADTEHKDDSEPTPCKLSETSSSETCDNEYASYRGNIVQNQPQTSPLAQVLSAIEMEHAVSVDMNTRSVSEIQNSAFHNDSSSHVQKSNVILGESQSPSDNITVTEVEKEHSALPVDSRTSGTTDPLPTIDTEGKLYVNSENAQDTNILAESPSSSSKNTESVSETLHSSYVQDKDVISVEFPSKSDSIISEAAYAHSVCPEDSENTTTTVPIETKYTPNKNFENKQDVNMLDADLSSFPEKTDTFSEIPNSSCHMDSSSAVILGKSPSASDMLTISEPGNTDTFSEIPNSSRHADSSSDVILGESPTASDMLTISEPRNTKSTNATDFENNCTTVPILTIDKPYESSETTQEAKLLDAALFSIPQITKSMAENDSGSIIDTQHALKAQERDGKSFYGNTFSQENPNQDQAQTVPVMQELSTTEMRNLAVSEDINTNSVCEIHTSAVYSQSSENVHGKDAIFNGTPSTSDLLIISEAEDTHLDSSTDSENIFTTPPKQTTNKSNETSGNSLDINILDAVASSIPKKTESVSKQLNSSFHADSSTDTFSEIPNSSRHTNSSSDVILGESPTASDMLTISEPRNTKSTNATDFENNCTTVPILTIDKPYESSETTQEAKPLDVALSSILLNTKSMAENDSGSIIDTQHALNAQEGDGKSFYGNTFSQENPNQDQAQKVPVMQELPTTEMRNLAVSEDINTNSVSEIQTSAQSSENVHGKNAIFDGFQSTTDLLIISGAEDTHLASSADSEKTCTTRPTPTTNKSNETSENSAVASSIPKKTESVSKILNSSSYADSSRNVYDRDAILDECPCADVDEIDKNADNEDALCPERDMQDRGKTFPARQVLPNFKMQNPKLYSGINTLYVCKMPNTTEQRGGGSKYNTQSATTVDQIGRAAGNENRKYTIQNRIHISPGEQELYNEEISNPSVTEMANTPYPVESVSVQSVDQPFRHCVQDNVSTDITMSDLEMLNIRMHVDSRCITGTQHTPVVNQLGGTSGNEVAVCQRNAIQQRSQTLLQESSNTEMPNPAGFINIHDTQIQPPVLVSEIKSNANIQVRKPEAFINVVADDTGQTDNFLSTFDKKGLSEPCGFVLDASLQSCIRDGQLPYSKDEVLGEGGYGKVYLCHAIDILNRKTLKSVPFVAKQILKGKFNKTEATVNMDYGSTVPGILSCFGVMVVDEGYMMVLMEYYEGKTLAEFLHRCTSLDLNDAIDIFYKLLQIVKMLHDRNVVHYDIKDTNVMVMKTGPGNFDVKLIDFGSAKILDFSNEINNFKNGTIYSPDLQNVEGRPTNKALMGQDSYCLGHVFQKILDKCTDNDDHKGELANYLLWLLTQSELDRRISVARALKHPLFYDINCRERLLSGQWGL